MTNYDTDTTYPDIDSDIYKRSERQVRQAIRLLLKEGHPFEPSKLLRRQEVKYAMRDCQIPHDLLNVIVFPLMDIRDWIWEEYAAKQVWTLEEAACLAVGMDPLCYSLEPGQYYPGWRQERERAFEHTLDAIRSSELAATREGEIYLVRAREFCRWAYSNDLLISELASPLRGLAHDDTRMELMTPAVMAERWQRHAMQRLFADGLSQAERRKRELYAYAIALKLDNPKLTREHIARLVCDALSNDCQKLSGFGFNTVRNDLFQLEQKLDHPIYPSLEFFNSVPTDKEIMSTNPTHRWWSLWRGVIARKLPYLVLPE